MKKTNKLPAGVEIIEPSFGIQTKMGGSAKMFATDKKIKQAEDNLAELVPPLQKVVSLMLKDISKLARFRGDNARNGIWDHAHEIRGLAANANLSLLGLVANQICIYLNDTPDDYHPDADLITTLTVAALHTLKPEADKDEIIETLVNDCSKAVQAQIKREGRLNA